MAEDSVENHTPPPSETPKKFAINVAVISAQEAAEQQARLSGEESLNNLRNSFRGWQAWRRIPYRVAEEYFRQRYIGRVRERIAGSQNLFATLSEDGAVDANARIEEHRSEMGAIAGRWESGMLGEGEESQKVEGTLQTNLNSLLTRFAKGELTPEQYQTDKERWMADLRNQREEVFGKNGVMAEDIDQIANRLKEEYSQHRESYEKAEINVNLQIGRARAGLNTEVATKFIDRVVAWTQNKPVFGAINPATIGLGAALVGFAIRKPFYFIGGGGATGAVFGGMRRWSETGRQRAMHQRDVAVGRQFEEPAKRRLEMSRYIYESSSANVIQEQMGELVKKETLSEEEAIHLVDLSQEARVRLSLGEESKRDFLRFDNEYSIEQGKLGLLRSVVGAQLKASSRLGYERTQELSAQAEERIRDTLLEDISKKDKAFRRFRLKESAKAAAIGGVTGLTVGIIAQEVADEIQPAAKFMGTDDKQTTLEKVGSFLGIVKGKDEVQAGVDIQVEEVGLTGASREIFPDLQVKLPDNYIISEPHPDGTISITDPGGQIHLLQLQPGQSADERLLEFSKLGLDPRASVVQSGFEEHTKSVSDVLLAPERLDELNIVETSEIPKNVDFHVLRPDILAATGDYTHNELALHITSGGQLNFGGEVSGNIIPSHLSNVDSAFDPFLVEHAGQVQHEDLTFVVGLADGKQIMLSADEGGNATLPAELLNPDGAIRSHVSYIGSAVLTNPDGSILSSQDLSMSGVLPEGSTVHYLASVKLDGVEETVVEQIPKYSQVFEFDKTVVHETPKIVEVSKDWVPPPIIPVIPDSVLESTQKEKHDGKAENEKLAKVKTGGIIRRVRETLNTKTQERKAKKAKEAQVKAEKAEAEAKRLAMSTEDIVNERFGLVSPGILLVESDGSQWMVKDVVDSRVDDKSYKSFKVEDAKTGRERPDLFSEEDVKNILRSQIPKVETFPANEEERFRSVASWLDEKYGRGRYRYKGGDSLRRQVGPRGFGRFLKSNERLLEVK